MGKLFGTGNTERVAKDIASGLGADIDRINEKDKRGGFSLVVMAGIDALFNRSSEIMDMRSDPSQYDITIVGTPVWWYKMTPAVRAYLNKYKDKLRDTAFFTTAEVTKVEKIVPAMEEITGKKAAGFTGFDKDDLKNEEVYKKKISDFVSQIAALK